MTKLLVMLIEGQVAGTVEEDRRGRLTLTYDEAWPARVDAIPVSLSMPLAQTTYADSVVRAFLSGLLPDNEDVLERWGRHRADRCSTLAQVRHRERTRS